MAQDGGNKLIVFGAAIAMFAVVALLYYTTLNASPTKNPWYYHLLYWAVAALSFAIPPEYSCYMFDHLSVTLIGTVFPMYEALRAICTPDEDDDKYWLQYYIVGGVLFSCTQFVDEWMESTEGKTFWFHGMFFFYFWLYFPKTVGAALLYEHITEPYLAPCAARLTEKAHGIFSWLYHTSINACHIALLVLFFIVFPKDLKKVIAVAVGTGYPLLASIKASTTDDTADDDTYWLTYWTCYSGLFLLMELLETWVDWIPGFYAFYIATTLYLMLPMFNGSEKVFRKVLVPLARLQDMLLLRDAVHIKKRILTELDPEQGKAVKRAIVEYYDDDNTDAVMDHQRVLQKSQAASKGKTWMERIPGLGGFFGGSGAATTTDTKDESKKPAAKNDDELDADKQTPTPTPTPTPGDADAERKDDAASSAEDTAAVNVEEDVSPNATDATPPASETQERKE